MTAPWEEQDDKNLTRLLKKAKRRTLLRNTIISLVVTMVVLVGGVIGNAQLTGRAFNKAWNDEIIYQEISSPNKYYLGVVARQGFLSGFMEMTSYKIVGGVPIPWTTRETSYKALGFFSFASIGGSAHGDSIPVSEPAMKQEKYEYYRQYNGATGQRELAFYIPGVNYNGKVLNDLPELSRMEPEKLVEMAVSFDKKYSLEEVQSMLPKQITPMWYWVDTYDNRTFFEPHEDGNGGISYALPQSSSYIFGFGVRPPDYPEVKAQDFITSLENGLAQKGRYQWEYERIYNYLKKDKAAPDAGDVRLLGVVVTGTAQELQSLKGRSYVAAAVLGAVVDKY
ncbi:hypothetical protein GCM10010912_56220 [Paenibacillus albidus]|uniref:Sigma factor regulator C-terminal domain-containing protein n=1 Tax=Paenibacillus albidus TaxID=2041023 RepID=A0A917D082_9BACL|nr:anti-sigma factor [Paenibacillus albidus]GGG04244.1 hypothetical protein GCM10010912_56220 [Paenibacillus albidus]